MAGASEWNGEGDLSVSLLCLSEVRTRRLRLRGPDLPTESPVVLLVIMSHFLFVASALRERNSRESAELQLAHDLWGLRTSLIRDNLQQYLADESCGLVYVVKEGISAQFKIVSQILPFDALDEFTRDELRTEARYGFVRVRLLQQWQSSPEASLGLLDRVLEVPDRAELSRRLNLGMHRLTEDQYDAILKGLS